MASTELMQKLHHVRTLMLRLDQAALAAADEADSAIQMRIMEQILAAEDEESLFAAAEAKTTASKDFVNTPFWIGPEDIEVRASEERYTSQGGFPFFLMLNVIRAGDGSRLVVNSGAPSVIAVLDTLLQWEMDETRPIEKRPFSKYADRQRCFQFVERQAKNGTVILIQPLPSGDLAKEEPVTTGAKKR